MVEIAAWEQRRNAERAGITWLFTVASVDTQIPPLIDSANPAIN